MPNTFIDNRDAWLRMSETDYVSQFVKTWLAFNAWYRSAYGATRDREIIDEFKWQPNPVLNHLRPLLTVESEEAEQFRADIGLLHNRLENHEITMGKNAEDRIRLTNIYLRENPPTIKTEAHWGHQLTVERQANSQIRIEVVRMNNGNIRLQHMQPHFNLLALEQLPAFQHGLTVNLQGILRQLYQQAAPKLVANLLDGEQGPIACGAYQFRCGSEALFAGIVEALYLMRCTLFHGELAPTQHAIRCYEPAYRLVRRFLDCLG